MGRPRPAAPHGALPLGAPEREGQLPPVRGPRNAVLFGAALVLAGVVLAGMAFAGYGRDGDSAALWVAALLLVMFGGIGAWAMHVGMARLRWIRRFAAEYGFSPFDRRPDAIQRPGAGERS